jgi:hypothetical protein
MRKAARRLASRCACNVGNLFGEDANRSYAATLFEGVASAGSGLLSGVALARGYIEALSDR